MELPPRMRLGQVWDIMEDITRAVAFMHDDHEIHRDLKPSNGMLTTPSLLFFDRQSCIPWRPRHGKSQTLDLRWKVLQDEH